MFSAAERLYLHKPLNQDIMTRKSKIFVNQFIPFLVAHQAFDWYVANFIASFSRMPLDQFVDSTIVDCWIDCAFDFDDTFEGRDFWLRLNNEWRAIARHF